MHVPGLVEYLFEEFARISVEVEYASEFRYRNPIIRPDDVVIAISQKGETADTLAALNPKAVEQFLGFVMLLAQVSLEKQIAGPILIGPEIGVASTKAFTSQVAVLSMMALH